MAVERQLVYDMLTKEDRYAQRWAEGKASAYVSRETGQPYTLMEWLTFTEKYLAEAKLAEANYAPDRRAIRIRLMKAASLLVSGLQNWCQESDLEDIAGVSCEVYPILHGGLRRFEQETSKEKV